MSKSPFRAAARPQGRRSATRSTHTQTSLSRIAASAGATPGSPVERLGHRSAAVALSLGLIALAGGGAVATTAGPDLESTSMVEAAAEGTGTAHAALTTDAQARVKAEEVRSEAAAAAAAAEAARQAAAARAAEEARKAEELRAAEEARKAEEAKAAAQPVDDPTAAKAYAASRLAAYGWSQDQMSALEILWTKESGWRTTATNPTSGAYGIVQSLPATKMSSVGADWQTNFRTQIEWGLDYIKERYGSPSNALGFHYANNWY
ncbi:hypothetical protein [Sinomonas mesophila]|uniref:aggregation-promoting factor C-terminal-like domain-containing protein n=1 Tax=Sinomonas mesophila TaxID=1531955 RepID=UPI0011156512|nr:hypothetical protein [Sinomonas mesophila]